MFLVFVSLLLLFYLLYGFRRNALFFAGLAVIILPNIFAFVKWAPFVPTPMPAVRKMVEAAGLKPGDIVYDIGCGDGRIVHLAVKEYGATGIGIELSPLVYLLARARRFLWSSKAGIEFGNFKWKDFSDADAVFCYLSDGSMAELENKLKAELKKGARVVSYIYPFPAWKEKQLITFEAGGRPSPIWLYVKQ